MVGQVGFLCLDTLTCFCKLRLCQYADLNNAVYLFEDMLIEQGASPEEYEVDYGDRAEHCWNGETHILLFGWIHGFCFGWIHGCHPASIMV
eukprot:COSAG02_NODE_2982_length_7621_cov_3.542808_8_plen_91_part_00